MRIRFHKLSDQQHALEVVRDDRRDDGRCERVECETRSYLQHDLLHYATEAEAGLDGGVWGSLAAGRTLAEMNDRTGEMMAGASPELMVIEKVVGAMSAVMKGASPDELVDGLRRYAESLGDELPAWLDVALVGAVRERMRGLLGRWRATRFGDVMELTWPADPAD